MKGRNRVRLIVNWIGTFSKRVIIRVKRMGR